MARNGNTDSGIESDHEPECEQKVFLVVDIGSSILTSRDSISTQSTSTSTSNPLQPLLSLESLQPLQPLVTQELTPIESPLISSSFQLLATTGETITISFDTFSDYERQELPEFFEGRAKGKSPQSYVQIRNHFIDHWFKVKPNRFSYHDLLRRIGHLHLGNVTAFSRIHKFLEAHRVINIDALRRCHLTRIALKSASTPQKRGRKPKRSYVDNQMAKLGLTVTEGTVEDTVKLPSRTRPNPFKLVPCEAYESEAEAPFAIRLSMEALAIIDIHAHCVKTEVIGLLGGIYCQSQQTLYILTAEPCASLDDHDLQCDMEPVSQAMAKERLECKNYQVVGWYHSHPTFVPNPSLRDIETQSNFQQLFSKENGQPFIAFILSPYSTQTTTATAKNTLVSQFKCLWISDETNSQGDYRIPYELSPLIVRREKLMFSVALKLKELCSKVKDHASAVALLDKIKRFRGADISYLEKLCASMRHYLEATGLSSVECDYMIDNCKSILLDQLGYNLNINNNNNNNNNNCINNCNDNNSLQMTEQLSIDEQ